MNIKPAGGSKLSFRDFSLSIDLPKLLKLASGAIKKNDSSDNFACTLGLFSLDGKKLRIAPHGVVRRMLTDEAKKLFAPSDSSGFILDALNFVPPRQGTTVRVGGRLPVGADGSLTKTVVSLHEAIAKELDDLVSDKELAELLVPSFSEYAERIAKSLGERPPALSATASIQQVGFAAENRLASERSTDIGRVLSAFEQVDGHDWLEVFLKGVQERLQRDGELDNDDIDTIIESIRSQRNVPYSQIQRFLQFLEDEAFSRVRLKISMSLMEAMANKSSKPGFVAYVSRILKCFEIFAGPDREAITFDPSGLFGLKNRIEFGDYMQQALTYSSLPVWPEWCVQVFEAVDSVREVSYRFKVNGVDPKTEKRSFVNRIDRLQNILDDEESAREENCKRTMVNAIFLFLITPDSLTSPSEVDLLALAKQVSEWMRKDPKKTLLRICERLTERQKVMEEVADELISILKNKSSAIIDSANRSAGKVVFSLERGIVNWESVKSIVADEDILVSDPEKPDSVTWLKYLKVDDKVPLGGTVASYVVQTEINERSLALIGNPETIPMSRRVSDPVLPIRVLPYRLRNEKVFGADIEQPQIFDAGCGIEIIYDSSNFRLSPAVTKGAEAERLEAEHVRAAAISAFSVVAYIALWEIGRRLRTCQPKFSAVLARLQKNASARENDLEQPIIAICRTISQALSRDFPVKLQGLVAVEDKNSKWRNRGSLHSVVAGQPLEFPMAGSANKIAILNYVTRPSDSHPDYSKMDRFIFVSKTYLADREEGKGVLRLDRMEARLAEGEADFKAPSIILAEIARLREMGYEHVVLLSHHFGNRHVGRASERHCPHATLDFLEKASSRFPDVCIYAMRRDIFPATRLRNRNVNESGFEIISEEFHRDMYQGSLASCNRYSMPMYTFATLSVIDGDNRPQSGFCTYFWDGDKRVRDTFWQERVRQNVLGFGEGKSINASLTSVLRAIHFLESEKVPTKSLFLPVLDPSDWMAPEKSHQAGELEIMSRRKKGNVLLSLPALFANITKVLHRSEESHAESSQ